MQKWKNYKHNTAYVGDFITIKNKRRPFLYNDDNDDGSGDDDAKVVFLSHYLKGRVFLYSCILFVFLILVICLHHSNIPSIWMLARSCHKGAVVLLG